MMIVIISDSLARNILPLIAYVIILAITGCALWWRRSVFVIGLGLMLLPMVILASFIITSFKNNYNNLNSTLARFPRPTYCSL